MRQSRAVEEFGGWGEPVGGRGSGEDVSVGAPLIEVERRRLIDHGLLALVHPGRPVARPPGADPAFYSAVALLAATGSTSHPIVCAAEIILAAHVLEMPGGVQRDTRRPPLRRLVIGTLLFGFFWWIPVRRRLFAPAPTGA